MVVWLWTFNDNVPHFAPAPRVTMARAGLLTYFTVSVSIGPAVFLPTACFAFANIYNTTPPPRTAHTPPTPLPLHHPPTRL